MDNGRILIVEDEFLIRATLTDMLEDAGYQVVASDTADEALEILRNDPAIQLIMTDMSLPGHLNGQGLAAAVRALQPALPIIFVTGRPDLAPQGDAATTAVVAKPYTGTEIISAVSRFLAPPHTSLGNG